LSDCHSVPNGCKAVAYTDPNHVYNDGPAACVYHPDADVVAAASESWFVHNPGYTDSAHRSHGITSGGCYEWELNPASTGVQHWFLNYLQTNMNGYDFYFIDNDYMDVVDENYFTDSGGGCMPWFRFCYSTQEIPNNSAQVNAHASFVNAMHHVNGSPMYFFYQQASFNAALDVSAFAASSHFVGLSCESCVATNATPVRPTLYAGVLNEMAAVYASGKAFLLISRGTWPAGSATQILQRLATTGVTWLGYSEGHTIVWPNLEGSTNNLAIWPEDLIYPSSPIQTMVSGATDLQVASGVYRREFRTCYQAGLAFGRCAVGVNATSGAITVQSAWLTQSYAHIITLRGGDELSGGVASVRGAIFAPHTTLASGAALLLAQ